MVRLTSNILKTGFIFDFSSRNHLYRKAKNFQSLALTLLQVKRVLQMKHSKATATMLVEREHSKANATMLVEREHSMDAELISLQPNLSGSYEVYGPPDHVQPLRYLTMVMRKYELLP